MDIVNFFVLAKVERINQVLMAAAQENYFGKKYSWCVITKVIWLPNCNRKKLILQFNFIGWGCRTLCSI